MSQRHGCGAVTCVPGLAGGGTEISEPADAAAANLNRGTHCEFYIFCFKLLKFLERLSDSESCSAGRTRSAPSPKFRRNSKPKLGRPHGPGRVAVLELERPGPGPPRPGGGSEILLAAASG
eukprot:2164666-Rhodomonas_salina.1